MISSAIIRTVQFFLLESRVVPSLYNNENPPKSATDQKPELGKKTQPGLCGQLNETLGYIKRKAFHCHAKFVERVRTKNPFHFVISFFLIAFGQ